MRIESNVMKRKVKILMYGFLSFVTIIVVGCENDNDNLNFDKTNSSIISELSIEDDNKVNEKINNSLGVISCYSDINHDGLDEVIYINYLSLTFNSQGIGYIDVVDSEGVFLWEDNFGIVHTGWKEYYLVTIEGKEYLLLNTPDYSQDEHCEYYKLFYFNSDGTEIIEDEMDLSGISNELIVKKLNDYSVSIEKYKKQGVLLISTWDGSLEHYEKE